MRPRPGGGASLLSCAAPRGTQGCAPAQIRNTPAAPGTTAMMGEFLRGTQTWIRRVAHVCDRWNAIMRAGS